MALPPPTPTTTSAWALARRHRAEGSVHGGFAGDLAGRAGEAAQRAGRPPRRRARCSTPRDHQRGGAERASALGNHRRAPGRRQSRWRSRTRTASGLTRPRPSATRWGRVMPTRGSASHRGDRVAPLEVVRGLLVRRCRLWRAVDLDEDEARGVVVLAQHVESNGAGLEAAVRRILAGRRRRRRRRHRASRERVPGRCAWRAPVDGRARSRGHRGTKAGNTTTCAGTVSTRCCR